MSGTKQSPELSAYRSINRSFTAVCVIFMLKSSTAYLASLQSVELTMTVQWFWPNESFFHTFFICHSLLSAHISISFHCKFLVTRSLNWNIGLLQFLVHLQTCVYHSCHCRFSLFILCMRPSQGSVVLRHVIGR